MSRNDHTPSAPKQPSVEAQALLDAAPCGLLQTADDGMFLRVNRTFCEWIGLSADKLIGRRRFQDLLSMGGRIFHQTHWSPLLRMQGIVSEVKLDLVHTGGALVPMVVNAIRHEQDGAVVHEIAAYVARDRDMYEKELVIARKRLEVAVAAATRSHEEANDRALFAEQMIGIVSHDLRNPISSIMRATELLRNAELSSAQQRPVGTIARAAESATRLLGDLLDFTRARLGAGLTFAPERIDLHRTVAESLDELRHTYPGSDLHHVSGGDGVCVADPGRLAQLLGNLVSNAVTYGRDGAPITVSSRGEIPAAIILAVHNAGAAIPEDQQSRLFEPMTRGATATNSGRSVGLGLFIVHEIVKAHGGSMSVRSREGEGSTFTATLPRG